MKDDFRKTVSGILNKQKINELIKQEFICPECGSRELGRSSRAPVPRSNHPDNTRESWSNNEFLAIATSNVVLTGSCKD